MVDVGSDCNKKSFTTWLRGLHVRASFFFSFFFVVACVRDLGTELVPVLHTRENFVPDLHMCDEYLTNSSHVRSYLLEKFEHKSHLQFIEIYHL